VPVPPDGRALDRPELAGVHRPNLTATFVYGSYDGKMNFLEPMVTKVFLETKADFTRQLKLPARYAVPGHYPTSYRVTYDASANEHRITLGDFVRRD
jgi:hypothetical protein